MRIEAFLKQSLLFEVNRVSRRFDQHMQRLLRASNLHSLEALVLVAIFFEDTDGIRPSQLAETLGTTRGNLSHCVSSLEAKGLIQRRIDPQDARGFHLVLKPQGKKSAMHVIRVLDRMQKRFELSIGVKELIQALGVIRQVEAICESMEKEESLLD